MKGGSRGRAGRGNDKKQWLTLTLGLCKSETKKKKQGEEWCSEAGYKAWLLLQGAGLVLESVGFVSRGVAWINKKTARPLSVLRWRCWLYFSA